MRLFVQLDVDFATDEKIIAAGPMAAYLYICSLSLAKRTLSDGYIATNQLQSLSQGYAKYLPYAKKLVEVGLWEKTPDGWRIAAWAKRNMSVSEVTKSMERKRLAALKANHTRWHRAESPSDDCAFCEDSTRIRLASEADSASESKADSIEVEVETETETETETPPLPPVHNGHRTAPQLQGGRVDEALKIITLRERDIAGANIRHPAGWTRAVIERNRIDHGPTFNRLADEHPEWTPEQLADSLNPTPPAVVERPLCATCHRHTLGLYECPTARDNCPTPFVLQVLA